MKRSDTLKSMCNSGCSGIDRDRQQLDFDAVADAKEGIKQGLEDADHGRLRPARDFFAEFEASYGIDSA